MSNLLKQPPHLTSLDHVLEYELMYAVLTSQHLPPIFLKF